MYSLPPHASPPCTQAASLKLVLKPGLMTRDTGGLSGSGSLWLLVLVAYTRIHALAPQEAMAAPV